MYNQPKVLEYLLNTVKTYKSNFRNKIGRTALNIAAAQGAFECIEVLLNNFPCDINSTDKVNFLCYCLEKNLFISLTSNKNRLLNILV